MKQGPSKNLSFQIYTSFLCCALSASIVRAQDFHGNEESPAPIRLGDERSDVYSGLSKSDVELLSEILQLEVKVESLRSEKEAKTSQVETARANLPGRESKKAVREAAQNKLNALEAEWAEIQSRLGPKQSELNSKVEVASIAVQTKLDQIKRAQGDAQQMAAERDKTERQLAQAKVLSQGYERFSERARDLQRSLRQGTETFNSEVRAVANAKISLSQQSAAHASKALKWERMERPALERQIEEIHSQEANLAQQQKVYEGLLALPQTRLVQMENDKMRIAKSLSEEKQNELSKALAKLGIRPRLPSGAAEEEKIKLELLKKRFPATFDAGFKAWKDLGKDFGYKTHWQGVMHANPLDGLQIERAYKEEYLPDLKKSIAGFAELERNARKVVEAKFSGREAAQTAPLNEAIAEIQTELKPLKAKVEEADTQLNKVRALIRQKVNAVSASNRELEKEAKSIQSRSEANLVSERQAILNWQRLLSESDNGHQALSSEAMRLHEQLKGNASNLPNAHRLRTADELRLAESVAGLRYQKMTRVADRLQAEDEGARLQAINEVSSRLEAVLNLMESEQTSLNNEVSLPLDRQLQKLTSSLKSLDAEQKRAVYNSLPEDLRLKLQQSKLRSLREKFGLSGRY